LNSLLDTAEIRDVPDTTPEVREMKQSADTLPPIVDAAEFLAEHIEPPAELVEGIVHQGSKLVLGGGSKTFKTWTLIDLAVSVATGESWLGFDTQKGRVLFVNFEIQHAFFQKRIVSVTHEKLITLPTGQLDIWNLRGRATSYEVLIPHITERINQDYALIILDPIYKLYGKANENAANEVAQLLNAIEQLAVESGAAIAFGAHYSKGNQANKEAIDRISGSGVFARDPDSILSFTRHEEEDAFTVEATLRNFIPIEPFVVRWGHPLMRRDGSLDPAKLKQTGGRPKQYTVEKILDVLRGKKLTTQKWLEAATPETGISKTRFYALLEEVKKLPNVRKNQAGQWFIEDAAND
jgi:RecA-family ATPase